MNAPTHVQVATIDAEMRVVVHVRNLAPGITPVGLSELLGVTSSEIFSALSFPENTGFCTDLYEEIQLAYGPEHSYQNRRGQTEHIVLRPRNETPQARQVNALLDLNYALDGQLEGWALPRKDLVLPITDVEFQDLQHRFGYGADRARMIGVYNVPAQKKIIDEFTARVKTLEGALHDAAELTKKHGSTLAALGKARSVAMLQERHWWSEKRKNKISEATYKEHVGRLQLLDARLADLGQGLVAQLRETHPARMAGLAVLKYLGDTTEAGGGLPALVEVLATARWNISAWHRGRLIDLLVRAIGALSISPVAEKFLAVHGLDLLESSCRIAPEHYDRVLSQLQSYDLMNEVRTGWTETIADLRFQLKAETYGASIFSWSGKISKQLRSGMSLTTAVLTPTMIGILTNALIRGTRSSRGVGRRLSALALKALTTGPVHHVPSRLLKSTADVDFLNVITKRSEEVTLLNIVDRADATSLRDRIRGWKKAGEEIAELGINKNYTRRPAYYGSAVAFSVVALLATIGSDEDDPCVYGLALLGGVLGTSQAIAGASPYFLSTPGVSALATEKLQKWDRVATRLGRAAAVVGVATSVAVLVRADEHTTSDVLLVNWLNLGAGVLTGLAWVAEFGGLMVVAGGLGMFAAVLGTVALTAALIIEVTRAGPRELLEAYVGHIEGDDVGKLLPIELDAVLEAIKLGYDGDTFEDFVWHRGAPGNDPTTMSPTLFGTWKLGFSHLEISKLFASNTPLGRTLVSVEAVLPTEKQIRKGATP